MIETTSEQELHQPPEVVFDFLADPANEPAWNADTLSCAATSPGPVSVGSTRTGEYRHIGRMDSVITTFDRPGRLGLHASGKLADIDIDFSFVPTDSGGTRMTVRGTANLKGFLRFTEGALRPTIVAEYTQRGAAIARALDERAEGRP